MSLTKSMMAALIALAAAGAQAQHQAAPTPVPPKPPNSPSYGPVLHPQDIRTAPQPPATPSPQAAGDASPQAQEERAGQPPSSGKLNQVDPSTRPAPETVKPEPQGSQPRQQPARKDKQAQRRPGAVQRIESTPRIAVPAPPPERAQARAAPPPGGPQSTQVMNCMGSTCTDASGATYNAGGPGNTAVSSDGRLCTRNGVTMQCL